MILEFMKERWYENFKEKIKPELQRENSHSEESSRDYHHFLPQPKSPKQLTLSYSFTLVLRAVTSLNKKCVGSFYSPWMSFDCPSGLRRHSRWLLTPHFLSLSLGHPDPEIIPGTHIRSSETTPPTPNRSNSFCEYFPHWINVLRPQLVIQNNTSCSHSIQQTVNTLLLYNPT